jgi:RNA polymerase sigma factor (sigma-70 family)
VILAIQPPHLDGGSETLNDRAQFARASDRSVSGRPPVRHNGDAVARSSDTSWEARFRRGDRDVIEAVYRETFEVVRRAAGRVLREPADRDAVVHEVYTQLVSSRRLRDSYQSGGGTAAGGRIAGWLSAIARHRALDFIRRERRLTDLSALDEVAAATDPLADFRQDLERFADRLDPQRRRVLELRFVAGMTQAEAAAQLGMPRSTLEDREREIKTMLEHHLLDDGKRRRALA